MPGIPKNKKNIPVNSMTDAINHGISIAKIRIKNSDVKTARHYEEATRSHRDEGHTFHIVEKGTVHIEIDFRKYKVVAPSVVYMHPNQVHRILAFTNVTVCSLAIKNENLNPAYLAFLEEIAPAQPLALTVNTYTDIADTSSLCLHFSAQKSNRLYSLLLKDSCNALVAVIISAFLSRQRPFGKLSRFVRIAKSFKQFLETNYRTVKRPSAYARMLNLSTSYLNESLKNATGLSVSQHIQDRVMLEAKRLLYHTDQSVKEIAFELGHEDYPYFSRLFTRAAGMSAVAFRNKNRD